MTAVLRGQLLWSRDVGAELPPGATISSLASVPELGAVCVTASTGDLLLLSSDGRELEEVRLPRRPGGRCSASCLPPSKNLLQTARPAAASSCQARACAWQLMRQNSE